MKSALTVLLVAVLIVAVVAPPADAWGRHHHRHFRVGPAGVLAAPLVVASALVAAPFIIAGSAIAAATHPVVVPAPPVVIPAPPPVAVSATASYWYYCQSPRGYYPYVPQCPSGWLQVVPRPY
jgi:hypothetical protein